MSMEDCIRRAREAGEIDDQRAKDIGTIFQDLRSQYRGSMGEAGAEAAAARDTIDILDRELALKRRQTALQIKAAEKLRRQIATYRDGNGRPDFLAAAKAIIEFDPTGRAGYSNLVARKKRLLGMFHSKWENGLYELRPRYAGLKRANADNVIREIFGEDTGDLVARDVAKAWGESAEFARQTANAAGGNIPKREGWGMPQSHNIAKISKAGKGDWIDFVRPRLDPTKMVNYETGRPFSAAELDSLLSDVFDTIKTDGMIKITPGASGRKKLANRLTDHRFLTFKDAESWMEYQRTFGEGDFFSTMNAHLESMARDTAALEILGPNPDAMIRWIQDVVRLETATTGQSTAALDRARVGVKSIQELWGHYTGSVNAGGTGTLARSFQGLRNFLTAAQLGSAAISALSDLSTQRITAGMNGLSSVRLGARILKTMNPLDAGDRRLAVRLGLIAESWGAIASSQSRYVGEVTGPEISRRIADSILRATLLEPWTQAGRWAFGMEFMGTMADNVGKTFDQLPGMLRRGMQRYGITADDWNAIRATELYEERGATFLRPDDLLGRAQDLGEGRSRELSDKLMEMILTETEYAVPSSSLRGRQILVGTAAPGTVSGELVRSFAMYKNFAVTMIFTHLYRGLTQKTGLSKARYLANLFIGMTAVGYLSMQAKEIAKGRDPRSIDSAGDAAKVFGAAAVQGGGLGIFGDFFFADQNRFGGGPWETIAGPVFSFGADVSKLTIGNIQQAVAGEDTDLGREMVRFLKRYTPGSSAWYARLALERLIWDELQRSLDPEADKIYRRQIKDARREYGQNYWWRPGRGQPERAPDISKAIGE